MIDPDVGFLGIETMVYPWYPQSHEYFYGEPKFNLRIKLRKRMVCEKTEPLAASVEISQVCSMNLMHDKIEVGWNLRQLNVVDDFNLEAQGI